MDAALAVVFLVGLCYCICTEKNKLSTTMFAPALNLSSLSNSYAYYYHQCSQWFLDWYNYRSEQEKVAHESFFKVNFEQYLVHARLMLQRTHDFGVTLAQQYFLFFNLIGLTGMWWMVFGAVFLMVARVTALPMLVNMMRVAWDDSLTNKDPMLVRIGRQYLLTLSLSSLLESLMSHLFYLVTLNFGFRFQSKLHQEIQDVSVFRRVQAEDYAQKHQADSQRYGLARTLSSDPQRFLVLFLSLHKVSVMLLYWSCIALIELAKIGVLSQSIAVLIASMVCSSAITLVMTQITSVDAVDKASFEYESVFSTIVDNSRADKYPNMLTYGLSLLDNASLRVWQASQSASRSDAIGEAWQRFIGKAASVMVILSIFPVLYLSTDMTYGYLQKNVYNFIELITAVTAVVDFLPYIRMLRSSCDQLQGIYEKAFVQNDPMSISSKGLRTQGTLRLIDQNVLAFKADVFCAQMSGEEVQMRSYHVHDDVTAPLDFACGDVVLVTGQNGAGKSLLLTTLAQEVPGLEFSSGQNTETTPVSAAVATLYCEQDMFVLPSNTAEGQWTPEQLLVLLWPEKQTLDSRGLSGITGDTKLFVDALSSVTIKQMMEKIDGYLHQLHFNKDDVTTTQAMREQGIALGNMSGGQQQKLRLAMYFAMAEVLKPRIFMVDEPYNHLDAGGKNAVRTMVCAMREKGLFDMTTVLIVTHDDDTSDRLTLYDKVLAINSGSQNSVSFYGAASAYQQASPVL